MYMHMWVRTVGFKLNCLNKIQFVTQNKQHWTRCEHNRQIQWGGKNCDFWEMIENNNVSLLCLKNQATYLKQHQYYTVISFNLFFLCQELLLKFTSKIYHNFMDWYWTSWDEMKFVLIYVLIYANVETDQVDPNPQNMQFFIEKLERNKEGCWRGNSLRKGVLMVRAGRCHKLFLFS